MKRIGAVPQDYIQSYQTMFDNMVIAPQHLYEVDAAVNKINAGKDRYIGISNVTNVPWFFIGMIHYRESSCDFTKHLHNGDPLSARTVQVPAGRPVNGEPPFTFEESAIDALQYQGLTSWTDWSIPGMLYMLESFNGFGYRTYHEINSPYLWNYTQYYTSGMYVSDGVYSATAVSKQAGVAAILRRVMESNKLYSVVATVSFVGIIVIAALFYLLTSKNNLI